MADNRSGGVNATISRIAAHVASQTYVCRPGKIISFDPATNLAVVQPVIQQKVSTKNKVEYRNFPNILRVPVMIPYSPVAGLCLTVPIRKGDPCMLLFADRMMDNFVKQFAKGGCCVSPECCGGDNQTSEPRMHHLTDAICIPGLFGQPDRIPQWQNDAIELRNYDRTCFLRMDEKCNITIRTTGNATIKTDGDINFNAKGKVNVCGAGGDFLNESCGDAAFSVQENGSCCCAGSCSDTATDNCCNITTTGSMCVKSSCAPGTSNNCMYVDDFGSMCVRS